MQVECYGQSVFRLSTRGETVAIDPFGDLSALAGRGVQFDTGVLPVRDGPMTAVPSAP
jgi:hypothetical protein